MQQFKSVVAKIAITLTVGVYSMQEIKIKNPIVSKLEIVQLINDKLQNFEGYVQFSHRPIDKNRDIFIGKNPKVEDEKGFIYEAHFYNGSESISIRQVNDGWLVDEHKNTSLNDTQIYMGIDGLKIKMAQIWKAESDELCEGMEVMKLKKVVFAGFENG